MTGVLLCCLPALDVWLPLVVFYKVPPKNVIGIGGWLGGQVHQDHVRLLQPSSPLVMVALRAGRNHVRPGVLAAQVTRQDVVKGQVSGVVSAVLAGEFIPAEYLAPR